MTPDAPAAPRILTRAGLEALIVAWRAEGRAVIGPRAHDGAIVHAPVEGLGDLPLGLVAEASPGRARLVARGAAFFDHAVGAFPWKRILHPPRETLHRTRAGEQGPEIEPVPPDARPMALLGMRPCDLAALQSLDSVLRDGAFADPRYAARRSDLFLCVVNCRHAVETCFCASMGTGPAARAGFDLALTEIDTGDDARFLAEPGSPAGAALLDRLPSAAAGAADRARAAELVAGAAAAQSRRIDTGGLPDRLAAAAEHPHWAEVAGRCLSCANCTMVCPTCFCSAIEETGGIGTGETARERRWTSCFTFEFSEVHGGAVRASGASRYRQWLTHKLGTWQAQFGTAGCSGCGRCIAWCPVGIDITAEVAALQEPAP